MTTSKTRNAPGLGEMLLRTRSIPLQMAGAVILFYRYKVIELDRESKKFAKEVCDLDPEPSTSHQEPDAFRHGYSFAKLARDLTPTLAKVIGEFHEWKGSFQTGADPLQDEMDYFNNRVAIDRIGRAAYEDKKEFDDRKIAQSACDLLRNGDFQVIRTEGAREWIERSRAVEKRKQIEEERRRRDKPGGGERRNYDDGISSYRGRTVMLPASNRSDGEFSSTV